MSRLVRHVCKIRNRKATKGANEDLQRKMNTLIRENFVNAVENENRKNAFGFKKWWDTVNKITGRKAKYNSLNIDPEF